MIHQIGKKKNLVPMTRRRINGGSLFVAKVQKTKPVPPNKVAAAVRGRDFQASHQTRTVVTKTITVEIIVIIMTEIIKNLQIEMMMMEK